jgi:hypothetical protein
MKANNPGWESPGGTTRLFGMEFARLYRLPLASIRQQRRLKISSLELSEVNSTGYSFRILAQERERLMTRAIRLDGRVANKLQYL